MSQPIQLAAAFLGLKFLPHPLVLGSNNLNPKLILHDEQVEYRATFSTDLISYTAIEKIDVYFSYKTTTIRIIRQDSVFTFAGNLSDKNKLVDVLQFFKNKNCLLTDKASKVLQEAC